VDQSPVTILIIDGDAASRKYLSVMLQKEGYQVLTSQLGREGLISAWKDQPGIIIFDPVLPDLPGTELLSRLHQDRRTANVPCVALSSREDMQEMSTLLAAGCNEYLVKSGDALPRLMQYLSRLLKKEALTTKRGKLFVFLSAKGGCGTSSLCANLAMCVGSNRLDNHVAVVDLVLPIGSIANIVGYNDHINIVTVAMQQPETTSISFLKENLPRVPGWYFHLLASAPDPASANQLPGDRVEGILNVVLEAYDYVFVDLGRALSRISLPIIQRANILAFILGTDLATSTLTQITWEYIKTLGVDSHRVYAIQNRSVGLEGLTKAEAERLIGIPIQMTVPYMGGNFTVANNRHEPFTYKFPNDSASIVLQQIALEMLALAEKQAK
jgi:CheY-like chemotaxis protein/MinD-like ATPase involved in chromosome partitioning or flagellar assembly